MKIKLIIFIDIQLHKSLSLFQSVNLVHELQIIIIDFVSVISDTAHPLKICFDDGYYFILFSAGVRSVHPH